MDKEQKTIMVNECHRCNSKDLTYVNETYSYKTKLPFIFIIMLIGGWVLLLTGILLFALSFDPSLDVLKATLNFNVGLVLMGLGIPNIFTYLLIKALQPYKVASKIVVICKNCHEAWYLEKRELFEEHRKDA